MASVKKVLHVAEGAEDVTFVSTNKDVEIKGVTFQVDKGKTMLFAFMAATFSANEVRSVNLSSPTPLSCRNKCTVAFLTGPEPFLKRDHTHERTFQSNYRISQPSPKWQHSRCSRVLLIFMLEGA